MYTYVPIVMKCLSRLGLYWIAWFLWCSHRLTWSESDFVPPSPFRTVDAQQNVAKRLEFIEREMNKLNGLIGEKQKAQKVLADEIVKGVTTVSCDWLTIVFASDSSSSLSFPSVQQEMQRKAAEEAHLVAAEALLGVH